MIDYLIEGESRWLANVKSAVRNQLPVIMSATPIIRPVVVGCLICKRLELLPLVVQRECVFVPVVSAPELCQSP